MVKSIVNTVGTKFISALFNFLILLLTANYLGTEGRGQISLIIATITIVLLFANFVGGNTLVYLSPRKPVQELLLLSYFWTLLSAAITFLILFYSHAFEFTTSLHISLLSLLFSFTSIHISILFGKEKITLANKISLTQVILQFFFLAFCFLVLEKIDISVFIYSLYITYGIACLTSGYYLKEFFKNNFHFNLRGTLKMALGIGALAQTANIFQFLNYRLDIYLLNKFDSLSHIGIYSSAVSIAEAVLLFGGSFALVQFSKISNTEDENLSRQLTVKLTRFSFLLTLIAYLPLFIFPDDFYNFLLGKDFHGVRMLLIALAPGIILLGSSVTLSHYFAGIGKYKVNALASFSGLISTFFLGIYFIPKYGFIAAAWVSSVSYLVSTVVLLLAFLLKSSTTLKELLPGINDLKSLQKSLSHVRDNRNS